MTILATVAAQTTSTDLDELAAANAERYRTADPFPHIVLDDFVDAETVAALAAEYPRTREEWQEYVDAGNSKKLAISDESRLGPVGRSLVARFHGIEMIRFLERLTGISGLVGDPHLLGGGLHQLEPGGFLRIHADFNRHPQLNLDRRINLLLYLNEGWQDDWGGELELWSRDMKQRVQRIAPIAGRVVLFNTTSSAYHGNPTPVACPEGMARRSFALYYYTNGRPEEERKARHTTLYQTPGEAPLEAPGLPLQDSRPRRVVRRLVPPVLIRAARRLRR